MDEVIVEYQTAVGVIQHGRGQGLQSLFRNFRTLWEDSLVKHDSKVLVQYSTFIAFDWAAISNTNP